MSSRVSRRQAVVLVVSALAILGLQAGLLEYFGGAWLFSDVPVAGLDYDTHISQAWRVLEGLQGWGKSWVYDVQHLAGYPNGTVFDADNKGWELLTYVLVELGMSKGQAFNVFVILAHMLVGPVTYASARLFRLARWSSLCAAAFAVLYWNFDSYSHWCWYVGMTAFCMASFLYLLPLGLFYRWLDERRGWQIAAMALILAAAHLVHPYSFLILVVPMSALYVRSIRELSAREHALVVGAAVLTVAVNLYWLLVAADFWHYVLDSSLFAETGVSALGWDVLNVMTEPATTGIIGKRAAFRTTIIAVGAVGLISWWRRSDPRLLPLGIAFATMFLVAYFGGYTFFAHTQPYRYLLPLGFLATIPAAAVLEHAVRSGAVRRFNRAARVTALLLALPASLFLAQDALYFLADSLPVPTPLPHGERVALSAMGYPQHATYRYDDWNADDLAHWIRANDDGSGRFLIEGWSWGEQVTWKTDAQVLGGFIWRNLEHSWSNFFRQRPQGIAHDKELGAYFRRYAVQWVILTTPKHRAPWWDKSQLLVHETDIFPFRIYRVKEPAGFVAKGLGSVKASTNRLEVRGTDPAQPVVLRFHWLESLVCEPDCRVQRKKLRGDKVGFIRIPAPHPADFVVFNSYRMP